MFRVVYLSTLLVAGTLAARTIAQTADFPPWHPAPGDRYAQPETTVELAARGVNLPPDTAARQAAAYLLPPVGATVTIYLVPYAGYEWLPLRRPPTDLMRRLVAEALFERATGLRPGR